MILLYKLWSFFTNQKLVVLIDYNGEETITFAKRHGYSTLIAKRYWPYNLYNVELLEDGSVSGKYPHVKTWRYY